MNSKLFILFIGFILSGCNSSLVSNTYQYVQDGSNKEAHTAFIILSNIELTQSEIEIIKEDYENETDISRKFLYEYLLAKRTQERQYILSFIKSSENNAPILLSNTSAWVSIGSPTLKLLSIYSKTNDDALIILLKFLLESDGANQSIIASDLRDAYELDPIRFIKITKEMDFDINDILLLMEDE